MRNLNQKLKIITWTIALCASSTAYALTLSVVGWAPVENLKWKDSIPQWIGDDPVIGRLACPAITRLDLRAGKNIPLLLKTAPIVEKIGKSEIWIFNLRQGLKWWNGDPVNSDSFGQFVKQNMDSIVSAKLGITVNSKFEVQSTSSVSVKIIWQDGAPFGPNIFAGVSLTRQKDGSLECAGLYAARQVPNGVDLTLGNGYTARYSKIYLRSSEDSSVRADHAITFSMANNTVTASSVAIQSAACSSRLDAPMVSAMVWNEKSPFVSSALIRQSLTMATPRGEILRTAAGEIGSLVSAPILRSHPGYDAKSLVRSYSLEASHKILDQEGYKQTHIGMPRTNKADKPLALNIVRGSGKQALLEKMISDSFASLGIDIKYSDDLASGNEADASLVTVLLPWPSLDLRSLSSDAEDNVSNAAILPFSFGKVSDKSLRDMTRKYALSTTFESPDFSLLRKMHSKWFELEPWTILMAHQYCVSARGIGLPSKMDVLDPDWFRRLAVE